MDGETWFVDANSGAKKTAAQGGDPYESGYVESGGGGTKGADGTKGIAVAEDAPGVDAAHLAAAKKSFDAIAAQEQKHWDDTKQPQSVRDSIRTVTDIRVHLDFSTYLELCGTYVYRVDWSQDTDYNVKSKTFTHSISVKAQTSMSDLVLDRDNNGNPGPKDVARTTFQKNGPQ